MARIAVIGLGKLGAPLAAVLAHHDHSVIGVDVDLVKREKLASRVDPVGETGLGWLLRSKTFRGYKPKLDTVDSIEVAVANSDITFVVVATPSEADGKFSLKYVIEACKEIGRGIAAKTERHTVVVTSTVCPGDTDGPIREALENVSGKKAGTDFGLCYNPEFIALGSVIHDLQNPDFILVGESDLVSGTMLCDLYRDICQNSPRVARMSIINAEITKLAVNTFITTKISYANMLAQICEHFPGGDVDIVTAAVGSDSRIGRKYLTGSVSYGGPCFPRDNQALSAVSRLLGVPTDLPNATALTNQLHFERLVGMVHGIATKEDVVGVIGLTYKEGTSIIERAAGFCLASSLVDFGYQVCTFDESYVGVVEGAFRCMKITELVERSKVVVITLPYKAVIDDLFAYKGKTVIDCWRVLREVPKDGFLYLGVGLGTRV